MKHFLNLSAYDFVADHVLDIFFQVFFLIGATFWVIDSFRHNAIQLTSCKLNFDFAILNSQA